MALIVTAFFTKMEKITKENMQGVFSIKIIFFFFRKFDVEKLLNKFILKNANFLKNIGYAQ